MAQPRVIKDMTAFIDGQGFGADVSELTLPNIGLNTEEHIGAGMGGAIDIDMGLTNKIEAEMMITGMAPEFTALLGNEDTSVTFRGALKDGDQTKGVIVQVRGLYREVEMGAFKRKDKGSQKLKVTANYYRYEIAGQTLIEIDQLLGKRIINGVDQLADVRAALGE